VKSTSRNVVSQAVASAKAPNAPSDYLFYEKTTGTANFHVKAGPDGELPVDHAAGLLAMHCMVRGQSPGDYLIMVPAAPENVRDLSERAQKLLEAAHSLKASVKLTCREEEVLGGILRSLANKEIACELNVSERAVKFHVSSLLSKFKVRSRLELMREASQQAMKHLPAAVGSRATMIREFHSRIGSDPQGREFRQDSSSGAPTRNLAQLQWPGSWRSSANQASRRR
jgi:DNA-binding CsgD family transcriptional regulator